MTASEIIGQLFYLIDDKLVLPDPCPPEYRTDLLDSNLALTDAGRDFVSRYGRIHVYIQEVK